MKRFFVFLFILCTLLCSFCLPSTIDFAQGYSGVYCYYTAQDFKSSLSSTIQNGEGYIVSCDIKNSKVVKNMLNKNLLYGESFSFEGDKSDAKKILFNLDCVYVDYNNLDIVAYSPKIDYCLNFDNKQYNVQIAVDKGVVYVGFPTIYGGF